MTQKPMTEAMLTEWWEAFLKRRAAELREVCDGFDDPEERCPRQPGQCACYGIRRALEEGQG